MEANKDSCVPEEIGPVFDHPIADAWDALGPIVSNYLDSRKVLWTTIDVVRFKFTEDEKEPGQPVLWVGVEPKSLLREDAEVAALGCKERLAMFEVSDIDVAFRESVYVRLAGPQLLQYALSDDATAGVRTPLTPALGMPIARRDTPDDGGTGGLYIRESNNPHSRVFLLTAGHVASPLHVWPDRVYDRINDATGRHDIIILGSEAYEQIFFYTDIKRALSEIEAKECGQRIELSKERNDSGEVERIGRERQHCLEAAKALEEFHSDVATNWRQESDRVLGHVVYSPARSFCTSPNDFTEDWALIELDKEKIDWQTFKGNVIDLGTRTPRKEFEELMSPKSTPTGFKYPSDRLFALHGVVDDQELRRPAMLDKKGNRYFLVLKNGFGSGVTVGRASGIKSIVRQKLQDGREVTSMELAIHSYDAKHVFSCLGDSGSIVADSMGRIVGLLTGGTWNPDPLLDITYAMPFYWVLERIQKRFPNASVY